MMMQIMRKRIEWVDIKFWFLIVAIISYLIWSVKVDSQSTTQYKNIACPSLFSIARSSRDTLIVMKNVDVCNDFLMENLK